MRIASATVLTVASLAATLTPGCGRQSGSRATGEEKLVFEQRDAMLREANAKREARAARLKSMAIPELAGELEKESQKGVESFNSLAFAEAVGRGSGAASALRATLTKSDRSSLLGLLALRRSSASAYAMIPAPFRIAVLTDALKQSKYFNAWGSPTGRWEDASTAIIAEGRAALPALATLLSQTRPAPVWGSEGMIEYEKYHFRVCDYAWALINEIRERKVGIPTDAGARDKLIESAVQELP